MWPQNRTNWKTARPCPFSFLIWMYVTRNSLAIIPVLNMQCLTLNNGNFCTSTAVNRATVMPDSFTQPANLETTTNRKWRPSQLLSESDRCNYPLLQRLINTSTHSHVWWQSPDHTLYSKKLRSTWWFMALLTERIKSTHLIKSIYCSLELLIHL